MNGPLIYKVTKNTTKQIIGVLAICRDVHYGTPIRE